MSITALPADFAVGDSRRVSALLLTPARASALIVLAHGAGAGMRHASMSAIAEALAARQIASLRYQFPFMEQGSKRPDPPALCHVTVRAAVAFAARQLPGIPLFAGGRSFGARMTSQTQASLPLAAVQGLLFFAFPLHAANKPALERAQHLHRVTLPMLFLQGTRDALADLSLLSPLIEELAPRTELKLLPDADHSFHVRVRSGRSDVQSLAEAIDTSVAWMARVAAGG